MIGKIILCVAVGFYGLILRNNSLYKTELLGKLDLQLKNFDIKLDEKIKEKIIGITINLVMFGAMGFVKTFELAAILSSVALGMVNYMQNFDPSNPFNETFMLVNFLALGMLLIGLKLK